VLLEDDQECLTAPAVGKARIANAEGGCCNQIWAGSPMDEKWADVGDDAVA